MVNLVEFNNAKIEINGVILFENLNFVVEKFRAVSIVGNGKSVLLKAMVNPSITSNIKIANANLDKNSNNLYKKIAVVSADANFLCDTVCDELTFPLINFNKTRDISENEVLDILKYFDMPSLINKKIVTLSKEEQLMIKTLSYLVIKPDVLAIDDLFIYLSEYNKEKIISYLKVNAITLVLTTNDMEDTLYTDYIYIINGGKVVCEGLIKDVYKEEQLLKSLGVGLPFVADLSTQLQYYDLVNKIYLDVKELVGDVWK